MIEYLRHKEIDKDKWDTCINGSPQPKPYAWSWYLDIMSPGWEALMDDEYDSVFPVPVHKKYGISYLANPMFLQQLGLYSPDNNTRKKVLEIFDYMPEFYKFIDLCIAQYIVHPNYTVSPRNNFELDLSPKYKSIEESYTDACRKNIAKGLKNKPVVETSMKPADLIAHLRGGIGQKVPNIKDRDYQRLNELMEYCISTGKGKIYGVRNRHKEWIYGVFLLIAGDYITMYYSTSHESRERRTGYVVTDYIIQEYSGSKLILDFAGSSIPSVASFMESFGSKVVPYYRIYRNRLPLAVRWLKKR